MKIKMSELEWAAWILTVIGALNWGLVGVFQFDLVQVVFSTNPWLMRATYAFIGIAAAYWVVKMLTVKK